MAKRLLIDGFNLAYRCHFAMPELTRADGHPTGALHAWVKSIWRLQDQEHPQTTEVFFDLGGAQDRLALHPEYKANRDEMPEPLQKQVPLIKQMTRLLGLSLMERDGVESDDLLAARALQFAQAGDTVLIVSADKDFTQIVGDRILMLQPPPPANPRLGWRVLDHAGVVEKYGVLPTQMADYLALVGDSADNIPGLHGVGPKTAAKWLNRWGSLEGVLAAASQVEPERFRPQLSSEAERLRLNRRLTTLQTAVELPAPSDAQVNLSSLLTLLSELEMNSCHKEASLRYAQRELF